MMMIVGSLLRILFWNFQFDDASDFSSNATIDGLNRETTIIIADDPSDEPVIEFIDASGSAITTDNESDYPMMLRLV